jgi:hypothetical protein
VIFRVFAGRDAQGLCNHCFGLDEGRDAKGNSEKIQNATEEAEKCDKSGGVIALKESRPRFVVEMYI